ncbi:hypothetical protein FisN_6Lh439 [Fistulifera solaris]|uniref:Uncharacterized protein n=1 Tax=Fistulifera solaris TaxID=1519565 RepID=A0A1Z5JKZ3_FISSO|nr:hypothetical protein FisN_6Lh439 [Fistulifera solaris]|eukprot:GAX14654.1 hypothetical protein FisN_6Lh439 [Fistulifera solaris]
MVGMIIHSQVLEKLHLATASCDQKENAIHHWDEAVGFYTGSITDFPGEEGYLIFTVAEMECSYFGTCSEGSMARVNEAIFLAFLEGKDMLQEKQCKEVIKVSQRIKSLMMIPLVQRILRHAYELDLQENQQAKTQGDAAAFMASLAPHLYSCQRSSAHMLWNDLAPGNATKASFEVLKFNLERTYDCLGIRCEDVGGLLHIDPSGSGLLYNKGAEPCNYVPSPAESSNKTKSTNRAEENDDDRNQTASTIVFVALGFLVAAVLFAFVRYRSKKPTKVKAMEQTDAVASNDKEDTTVAVKVGEIA